ncbi:MAG: ABC transporter ATP-binding protein [Deltaproteobacteria bacterium]|nr:MAG: ABC transporter ATP-binding protein [Deltaproteobacteria bacterium]
MSYQMNLVNIEKSYGVKFLFSGLSMGIEKGDKIGVIGPNGSGKSTLLKIISGTEIPEKGKVNRIKNLVCYYLEQNPVFERGLLIKNIISSSIESSLEKNHGREGDIRKFAGLSGFNEYDEQSVDELSGGMKKRLALGCAMMSLPDILLLDEPTNHLDLEGIEWLENILIHSDMTFVCVTHDREFLNNAAKRIIEISPVYPGSHFIADGDFDFFSREKTLFLENQSEKVQILENKMKREDSWLSRSPKARTTKARFRVDSAEKLREKLNDTRVRNNANFFPEIEFEATCRKTKRLITAEHISKSFEEKKVFSDLSIVLKKNDRFSIIGKNGSGKTTLIDILTKKNQPDKGKISHVENLKIVYFDQHRSLLDKSKTPKEILAPESDSVIVKNRGIHIISWLKRFGIDKDQINQPVKSLSGGEQARILMADLVRRPCDIIFLDEPTNDLDIPTIEMLENSVAEFDGCIVSVTHDRYFAKSISSQFLCLNGDGSWGIFHDLSQWKKIIKNESVKKRKKKSSSQKIVKEKAPQKKLSYKYQYELDNIESKILEAEKRAAELEEKISEPENIKNQEKYAKTCIELKDCLEKVENLYERWDYLESLGK